MVIEMTKSRTVVLTNEERGFMVACLEDLIEDWREYLKDEPHNHASYAETEEQIAQAKALIAKLPPI